MMEELERMQQQQENHSLEITEAQTHIHRLEQDLKEAQQQQEAKGRLISELQGRLGKYEEGVVQLRAEQDQLYGEREQQGSRITVLEQTLSRTEQAAALAQTQVTALNEQNKEIAALKAEVEDELAETK